MSFWSSFLSHHMLSSPAHSPFPPVLPAITRSTFLKYYFNWSPILVQRMLSKIPSRTFKTLERLIFHICSSPTRSLQTFHCVLAVLMCPLSLPPFLLFQILPTCPQEPALPRSLSITRPLPPSLLPRRSCYLFGFKSRTLPSPKGSLSVLLTLFLLPHCLGCELSPQRNWVAKFSKYKTPS